MEIFQGKFLIHVWLNLENHKKWSFIINTCGTTSAWRILNYAYTLAVLLIGFGFAHCSCGQEGRGFDTVDPKRPSMTLEYRWRWFPTSCKAKIQLINS